MIKRHGCDGAAASVALANRCVASVSHGLVANEKNIKKKKSEIPREERHKEKQLHLPAFLTWSHFEKRSTAVLKSSAQQRNARM